MDKPNTEFWFMPSRRAQKGPQNNNQNRKPKKFQNNDRKGKGAGNKPSQKTYSSGPSRRKLEDSPFAALAALQTPKKD